MDDPTHQPEAAGGHTLPSGVLQDRNGDGAPDYLNARIYIARDASAQEVAAAANIGARLAFEALSLDLPIGARLEDFAEAEAGVAIAVGRAARRWSPDTTDPVETRDGSRHLLAIVSPEAANRWAVSDLGSGYARGDGPRSRPHRAEYRATSLADLFGRGRALCNTDARLSIGPGATSPEIIDFAARIAVESTRLRLPLAFAWNASAWNADAFPGPVILIGHAHPAIATRPPTGRNGEGVIELLGPETADETKPIGVLLSGADPEGEARALRHAAGILPYLGEYGPGQMDLAGIETEIHDFVTLRSWTGQLAAGMINARERMPTPEPGARAHIVVSTTGWASPRSLSFRVGAAEAEVRDIGFTAAVPVFEDTLDVEWEVDRARDRLADLVPLIRPGTEVDVEVRLSEPPEVRRALEAELTDELLRRGADPNRTKLHVLSAHKQALSWITEALIDRIRIASKVTVEIRDNTPIRPGSIESPERWLQELYPVDEVLSRETGLSPSDTTLVRVATGPTYRVVARDASGGILVDECFEPMFVEQPLFAQFSEYATSIVSTGWIRARLDGQIRIDDRVRTDPETVWEAFQTRGLERLGRYLRDLYDGAPDPTLAPHFGTFEVDVAMSEPDERLGIDEERISTVEALHEDIYFMSLLFIQLTGQRYSGCRLPYPGRIVPRVRARPGAGPSIRLRLTGKSRPAPALEIRGPVSTDRLELRPVPEVRPRIRRVTIGGDGALALGIDLDAPLGRNTAAMFRMLDDLRRTHGVQSLSYPGVAAIDVRISEGHEWSSVGLRSDPGAGSEAPSREPPSDRESDAIPSATALDPAEAALHVGRLANRPGIRAFLAGRSFLGRPVWAMEVTVPMEGQYVSRPRLVASRPVLFLTGRQHGNEVSSTSHILRLVEWLVPDDSGRVHPLLRGVSVLVLPVTNPDGAALAAELARDTPDFMLHAGYYGCLGEDVTRDLWNDRSPYPEAHVRRRLWETWQPDVVVDAHGYPSHEWVQLFGGYSGWFRARDHIRRDWWIPRGAFQPEASRLPDASSERDPAIEAIRTALDSALERRMGPINQRMRRRYEKYAPASPPTTPPSRRTKSFAQHSPDITLLETVVELPDETAREAWLAQLIDAGLEVSQTCVRLLGAARVETRRRRADVPGGGVFSLGRPRPVDTGHLGR